MASPSPSQAVPEERPFILVNMAITADGKTAPANEPFQPFGGKLDEDHMYSLRAGCDAILCAATTLNSGKIALDTGGRRHQNHRKRLGLSPHPLRLLVTGRGGLEPGAHVFQHKAGPILVWTTGACPPDRVAAYRRQGADVEVHGRSEIDFPTALRQLRTTHQVRRLLCEGGGRLNNALFNLGLVDELHLTLCPVLLAGASSPTISDGPGPDLLAEAHRMTLVSHRNRGGNVFLVYRPTPNLV